MMSSKQANARATAHRAVMDRGMKLESLAAGLGVYAIGMGSGLESNVQYQNVVAPYGSSLAEVVAIARQQAHDSQRALAAHELRVQRVVEDVSFTPRIINVGSNWIFGDYIPPYSSDKIDEATALRIDRLMDTVRK